MEEFHTHFVHEAQVKAITKGWSKEETEASVCLNIRVKIAKIFNKTYLLKVFPSPHEIPFCAKKALKKILREVSNKIEGGNDSSDEDTDTDTSSGGLPLEFWKGDDDDIPDAAW